LPLGSGNIALTLLGVTSTRHAGWVGEVQPAWVGKVQLNKARTVCVDYQMQ
jgi:hypothetical protein